MLFGALAGIVPLPCSAQLMSPPTMTQNGGTFNTVVITAGGNLTGNNMTVNPGGGQTGVKATAITPATAIATLTNTTINLSNTGGVIGLDANGTGASITLGAGSTIPQTNGGGDVAALPENGGTINLSDMTMAISGGGGNDPVKEVNGGIVTLNGTVITVSGGGGNGVQASSGSQITATNSEIHVTGFGGNFGVQATNSGTNVTLNNTSVLVDQSTGGGGWGVPAYERGSS